MLIFRSILILAFLMSGFDALAQAAESCLQKKPKGNWEEWANGCAFPISVAYCSVEKPIWGSLCGSNASSFNKYYTHMVVLEANATSTKSSNYKTAACRGKWYGPLKGKFFSDAAGQHECLAETMPKPGAAGCKKLIKLRDGDLFEGLNRAFKGYAGAKTSLALLEELQRELVQAHKVQPTIQALNQLALGAKTTSGAVAGILQLDPRTGVLVRTAVQSGSVAASLLQKLEVAPLALALSDSSVIEEVVKTTIANQSALGAALAATYQFASDLQAHKDAQADGRTLMESMEGSIAVLSMNVAKLQVRLDSKQGAIEAANRIRRDIDALCSR